MARIREIRALAAAHPPIAELYAQSGTKKVNLNLSPYRDMSPQKRHLRRTAGPKTCVPNAPKAERNHPTSFYWLYGSLEYKMSHRFEEAFKKVTKQIDRCVQELRTHGEGSKGSLLFDIIATRNHIAEGLPHRLGRAIYKYVEEKYFVDITTTFVGLTDNTARRVARDVYCRHKELSKGKHPFDIVDNIHMFVIYPQVENRDRDPIMGMPGFQASDKIITAAATAR